MQKLLGSKRIEADPQAFPDNSRRIWVVPQVLQEETALSRIADVGTVNVSGVNAKQIRARARNRPTTKSRLLNST